MANRLQVDADHPQTLQAVITPIKRCIGEGGVIAFPTDTFYGLGVDPSNAGAVQKIFDIKERPADKPILILIDTRERLNDWAADISPLAQKAMDAFWPGPLTLLFPARDTVSELLTAGSGKIGIRLPDSKWTRQLIEDLGHALTAPSANKSEGGNPVTADDVNQSIGNVIDWIIDTGAAPGGQPSTVLDTTAAAPVLVREGAVSRQQLESALGIALG
ncbi:L-threonylcarbamoyladenylate synthase [Nitrospina watsonii]|uniref:L-threonylcarbamoyladenylate synthase n=1 Tax=Nitrospina watsonii TaxID=1323948 RepID=A0ABN8VXV7_9BACT|nr:L-threonylcarbamoyladenylate synthase [Nitrospina watsonii]CAI2717990.1 Sua5 YciO YrdC YwlC family protein [Nitrospina watsonii]